MEVTAFIFPEVWQKWDERVARNFYAALKDFGVQAICTEAESYRSDLIEIAHQMDLKWIGGMSCFSDHASGNRLVTERPQLHPVGEDGGLRPQMEWYLGVTPTYQDYNQSRLELVERIVRSYELDGFFLDFIRWPVHWELELRPNAPKPLQYSFDNHSLKRFEAYMGLQIPPLLVSGAEKASWILQEHFAEWVDFKCGIITRFVQEAAIRLRALDRQNFMLGMYTLPLPPVELEALAGQHLSELKNIVDCLAPMVYHAILHRDINWISQIVEAAVQEAPGQIMPVLQVDSAEGVEMGADWGPPIPIEEWQAVVEATLGIQGVCGVAAFTGTALFRDGRGEALARILHSKSPG